MNGVLYQNTIFKAFDLMRGRRNIERLKFLRKSQYWPSEQIKAWQLEKLNALLLQAKAHSPFHRDRLAGVDLPLKSLDEIQSIPIMSKQEIRENKDLVLSSNLPPERREPARTGGSTGEPMHYYWDKSGMDWNRGTVYRSQEWSGTCLGENTVQMMGSHFDYSERQNAVIRFMLWLQRYKDLPVAVVTDEVFERYLDEVNRFKPSSIWGYASGIHGFARFIESNHPGARFDFLKALITSSETLFPKQRETINRVFGPGKVFDHYGSREMYMASECREHDGYHIHAETILLEIVDAENRWKKPGERGRVILTDLFNHAFPFIRYEIGDVGSLAEARPCPCGVTLPKMAQVEGRIGDLLVLKDRVLTPPNLTLVFSDFEGIDAYQVRQTRIDEVEVNVVKSVKCTPRTEAYIRDSLTQLMGPETRLSIHYVDEIEVPKSGKRRYIISDVAGTQLGGSS